MTNIHKILLTVNRKQCHLLMKHQSSLNCSIHQNQNCNFLYHYFLPSVQDDLKIPVVNLDNSRNLDFKMSQTFIFYLVQALQSMQMDGIFHCISSK